MRQMHTHNHHSPTDQRGMVSIMVTMIMMLIISLIVIGFAQVVRRNQNEALDRQLSTQAFYAADSGVNDTVKTIKAVLAAGGAPTAKTNCDPSAAYPANPVLQSDSSGNPTVSYTCLTVDPNGPDIQLTAKNGASAVVPINSTQADGTPMNTASLDFSWQVDSGGNTSTAACNDAGGAFPPTTGATSWGCDFAVLRVDLMQDTGAAPDAATLAGQTVTYFFKPGTGAGSVTTSSFAAPQAVIGVANCVGSSCKITLTLSGGAQGQKYYTRLTTLYRDAPTVTIAGTLTNGSTAHFSGAQAVIDVTGKARDVLRRLQARVPLTAQADSTLPSNSLQTTGSICKRYTAAPGLFQDSCP
jgi:Tfp pilus assembly protein PilX